MREVATREVRDGAPFRLAEAERLQALIELVPPDPRGLVQHLADGDDAYPIALMLQRAYPGVDPAGLALEKLREWVVALDGFADDPQLMSVEILEQIQAEWLEVEN